jgi:mono/diheme cytochrome c family protein
MRWPAFWLCLILSATVAVGATVGVLKWRGYLTPDRPRHVFWDMKYQPKYTAQGQSDFFKDGRAMRMPVPGTVPFAGGDYFSDSGRLVADPSLLQEDSAFYRGIDPKQPEIDVDIDILDAKGSPTGQKRTERQPNWVRHVPLPVGEAVLRRGAERYGIHCAVCHGAAGYGSLGYGPNGEGKGLTTLYGMAGVASFHQDALRERPDGELFNTITKGKNSMPAYSHQIKPADRWAVVAYLRVLQRSQYAWLGDVPAEERARLHVPEGGK